MQHRRTLKWMALALLLGALAVAGCKKASDPNVIRFRYWGDVEEIKIVEGMLKQFEAAHPGIKVRAERKAPDGTYVDILLQEFSAGIAPDVIFISTDHIANLVASGKLADLTPYLEADKSVKTSDFYPEMIRHFSVGKSLYLLPRDIAPISCVFYNKALFDAAGLPYPKDDWTWDDLRRTAIKLTQRDADGRFKHLGFADDWNLQEAWVLAAGGGWVDDEHKPTRFTFADKPGIDGLLFRYNLMQVDQVMPSSADTQSISNGNSALFANGNLAMFHSGYWKVPGFKQIKDFKWDIARFPRKAGATPRYYSGGSGYALNKDMPNSQLGWELIKFMAGPEGQGKLAAAGLAQPSLKKLAQSKVFLDGGEPQNKKMLLYCADRAQASPPWVHWLEFHRTVLGPQTDLVWVKGFNGDPAEVFKKTQAIANAKFFGTGGQDE